MLYFLYYTIHVPVIAKIVSFIMGIVFGFLAHKFSRHAIANFFGIYYGGFVGAIIGCMISERLRYVLGGALLGVIIMLLINRIKEKGSIFVMAFICFMQITYISVSGIIQWSGVDFYEFTGHPDLLGNHMAKEFAMVVALIVGVVAATGISIFCVSDILFALFCSFICSTHLVGFFFSFSYAPFYMSGEWSDFFIPLMNMDYPEDKFVTLQMMFLITTAFMAIQMKISKKKCCE